MTFTLIAAFCGVSFFLAIIKTSKLCSYILHQFGGLHKLWDTPRSSPLGFTISYVNYTKVHFVRWFVALFYCNHIRIITGHMPNLSI